MWSREVIKPLRNLGCSSVVAARHRQSAWTCGAGHGVAGDAPPRARAEAGTEEPAASRAPADGDAMRGRGRREEADGAVLEGAVRPLKTG